MQCNTTKKIPIEDTQKKNEKGIKSVLPQKKIQSDNCKRERKVSKSTRRLEDINKMITLNSSLPGSALNLNRLNSQSKRQGGMHTGRSRWWSQRTWSSTLLINTPKLYLHGEQPRKSKRHSVVECIKTLTTVCPFTRDTLRYKVIHRLNVEVSIKPFHENDKLKKREECPYFDQMNIF